MSFFGYFHPSLFWLFLPVCIWLFSPGSNTATVRLKEDGRYELISGHRRKKACELAGLETLKCEVKELTRDEAIIVMVESNLQRSVILPSEKAFAYKMRLEAMNRQAGRPSKDNLTPMVSDLDTTRTNEKLGKEVGESREQIRRYIRLTELVPEILQMVDERQIAFRPAVEISYLTEEYKKVMDDFKKLCDIVGVYSMGWRYDPILIDDKHSVEWHITEFEKMAENLCRYTKSCVISFIDIQTLCRRG